MNKKFIIPLALFSICVLLVISFFASGGIIRSPEIKGQVTQYVEVEEEFINFPARAWVAKSIEILKEESYNPPQSARAIAYVASIYHDVWNKTGSEVQASLATAEIFRELFPDHKVQADTLLNKFHGTRRSLHQDSRVIVNRFINRMKNDGSSSQPQRRTSTGNDVWYSSEREVYPRIAANHWKTWVVDKNISESISDFRIDGINGFISRYISRNLVDNRDPGDEYLSFFWEGIHSFRKNKKNERVPLAGLWQNILFKEAFQDATKNEYIKYQKVLSQAIADSAILSWKAKYDHLVPRPSMQIPRFDMLFENPPYPGYPSYRAVASTAASLVLSSMLEDEAELWRQHAYNASYSRVLAGANFLSSVQEGISLGKDIGKEVVFSKDLSPVSYDEYRATPDSFERLRYVIGFFFRNLNSLTDRDSRNPSFKEVSEEVGLDKVSRGFKGAAWSDYNNDGHLDLLTPSGLYQNDGEDFFKVDAQKNIRAPGFWGDYNNDGCPDLFVSRSGPRHKVQGRSNKLFKNDCRGGFEDVTQEAGITRKLHSLGAAWGDYNNDGYLDVYVVNMGGRKNSIGHENNVRVVRFEPNVLYRNNGNGTFTEVTQKAGVEGVVECNKNDKYSIQWESPINFKFPYQPAWLDYDNDNDQDLFVVTDSLLSILYRNNGDGTFTQVTQYAGLCEPGQSTNMGAAIGDYNNDQYLDIYITNVGDNYLWMNQGDGTFKEKAKEMGANERGYGWGTDSIDYNNDGYSDIALVNGNIEMRSKGKTDSSLDKNDNLDNLLRNNQGSSFEQVGGQSGFMKANEATFSLAVGDYNNDGFQDIFVPASNNQQLDSHNWLFKNNPNDNNWITLMLIGDESNRMAIGARAKVYLESKIITKEVSAGSSFLSQSSPWLNFGLSDQQEINKIEVYWPSGRIQKLKDIDNINRHVVIKEGVKKLYDKNRWKQLRVNSND